VGEWEDFSAVGEGDGTFAGGVECSELSDVLVVLLGLMSWGDEVMAYQVDEKCD
jgi:hypothetical protein